MNSDSFQIAVDPAAARELKSLHRSNRDICEHIKFSIDSLACSPFQGKPLKGSKKGCYSLRFRDYRVIYEVYPHLKTIHILRVGHRRDVYR